MTQLQDLSAALAGLVAKAAPGLVAVHSRKSRSTGFAWKPGLVVTADEALAEEGDVEVALPDGKMAAARIAGRDPSTDIALLRVESGAPAPLRLDTAAPATGSLAVTVGMDRHGPVATLAMVASSSGAWRSMRGGDIDARIALDARMRRSSEGGLALDAEGRAFGMTVLGPRRRVLVIPSATIERVAARLEQHGRIPRGYLGLALQPVSAESGGRGALVMNVDPKGPGAAAGIHQGDVVVGWNGQALDHVRPMLRALGPDSVGQQLKLEIQRGGQRQTIELKVGERPAA